MLPKLKKIDLSKRYHGPKDVKIGCGKRHDDIKPSIFTQYLAKINGFWHVVNFSEQWHGLIAKENNDRRFDLDSGRRFDLDSGQKNDGSDWEELYEIIDQKGEEND